MPRVQKSMPESKGQPFQISTLMNPPMTEANSPQIDQIARRAYELFLARGSEHGHDVEDWLQAEREIRLGRYN
jgi:hypothetical protein